MPSFVLPTHGVAGTTSTHAYYSLGRVLHRRDLTTNMDERVCKFPFEVPCLQTNDSICMVASSEPDGLILWVLKENWEPFAWRVQFWILTPNRVVYEDKDRNIMAWDFRIAPVWVARGRLCSASDTRVIYDDGTARRWQNGTTPFADRYLTRTDEILTWEELYDRMDQFI